MSRKPAPPVVESQAQSVRVLAAAMFRTGLWLAGGAAAAAVLAATVLAGGAGLAGAAVGASVGLLSGVATVGLMRLTAALPVTALFGAVLGGYLVKILLLLAVVAPLREVPQLHPLSLGLSVLAVVVAWAAAEVVAFRRTPIPTIVPTRE